MPPSGLLPHRPGRAHPYFYSDDEVRQLLAGRQRLAVSMVCAARTYHCLLGLLAVTGLRSARRCNLSTEDVDRNEGVLTIRGAKFGKSRLVPMHPSTRKVLYQLCNAETIAFWPATTRHTFCIRTGTGWTKREVRRTFYTLSRQIGLRGPSDASHGPRLHDFRHRFAVETLVQWYRSGQDVERRLPVLSTYLGHVHVADTYWYLSACPELMGLAVKRFEDYWEKQS